MTLDQLNMVLDWAAAEGWNPGLHDGACFHGADPNGFLIGLVDGVAVASIFAVKYGTNFGFIGGYIVKPAYRAMGYGLQIWNAAMAYLAGRTIGLDGVLAQQANYARSGFHLAYRNIRFEGRGSGQARADDGVVPLATLPFDAVCRYDRALFPEDRTGFLQCWIGQHAHTAIGIGDAGGVRAFAVLRPCRDGHKIGPLFADTPALAETLLVHLEGVIPQGAPLFLDVPELNTAAMDLARRHGMRQCFETARMYTSALPDLMLARQFGVTTFELG